MRRRPHVSPRPEGIWRRAVIASPRTPRNTSRAPCHAKVRHRADDPARKTPRFQSCWPPRAGFCAGVDRAIQIVEQAIRKWGAPVYVRHEIVHNRHVVERLEALGAVFVEELDDCPADRPVIFSAHGVPKAVPAEARAARR